ncbi:MAG: hypothetical protein WCC64_06040 [Aliidongia sp.]
MAVVTGYALRLPASIMDEMKKAAEDEGSSINQFTVVAVARRLVAELKAMKYFERAPHAPIRRHSSASWQRPEPCRRGRAMSCRRGGWTHSELRVQRTSAEKSKVSP